MTSDPASKSAPVPSPSKPKRGRGRRVLRGLVLLLLVLCLLVAGGLWVVTRSWFIVSQVKPVLERRLGGEISIQDAMYLGDGKVAFDNVILRVPGILGDPGEIVRIGRAEVSVDLPELLAGRGVKTRNVEVDDVVLRLSEDAHESGRMNFNALAPNWTRDPKKSPLIPPRVRIRKAALEFGTHDGSKYTMLGRRMVSGQMNPSDPAAGWYSFELGEVNDQGAGIGPDGIFIKGEWNAATNEHHSRIDGLELDKRIYHMCPQVARLFWDRMQLEGKVDGVIVNWQPNQPFAVEFAVKNVALTLPIETDRFWARYHDGKILPTASHPRMRVSSGTIRIGSDSVLLEKLTGELGSSDEHSDLIGVPFSVSLSIPALPELEWDGREEWMKQVLSAAPFDLKFRMEEFNLKRNDAGESPAIDLPVQVAKVLAKFEMTNWVLSTAVDISRAAPTKDDSGTLVPAKPITTGQAYIHKASGRYQKFPYQVDDVDAYLQFDNDKITVHSLTGKGTAGGQIRVTGTIAPPDVDSSIDLHLTGTDVEVDDRLRSALNGNELKAFDMLLNKPAAEAMAAAGLLPDEAAIDAAKLQVATLSAQAAELKQNQIQDDEAQALAIAEIETKLVRLQRFIDAGPFKLGGKVNVDLKIERERGPNHPTITTGTIVVQYINGLYEKFPYPLRITGGTLDWQRDRIIISSSSGSNGSGVGAPFVTSGGGQGFVSGELGFARVDGVRKLRPNLIISVADDEMNPALCAAIPLTSGERRRLSESDKWPGGVLSNAGRIVKNLGLSGSVNYQGVIDSDPQGRVDYRFEVNLEGDGIQPNIELAQALGSTRELWPPDFTLNDVHGTVAISRDQIKWEDVAGSWNETSVLANGTIDVLPDQLSQTATFDFKNLPVGEYVLNASPQDDAAKLKSVWDRCQPQGTFDAVLEYESKGQDSASKRLTISPREVSVLMDSHRMTALRLEGDLLFADSRLSLNNLKLRLSDESEQAEGELLLKGDCGLSDASSNLQLEGTWNRAQFDSPLITEALQLFGGPKLNDDYQQHEPAGTFDADFQIRSSKDYVFNVRPRTLALKNNNKLVKAQIYGGQFIFQPGQIAISKLHGSSSDPGNEGAEFSIDGTIKTTSPVDANLLLDYSGQLRSDLVMAFLPKVAIDALDSIQFRDGGPTMLTNSTLHMAQVPTDKQPTGWQTDFTGRLQTNGASCNAGLQFTEIDSTFDLDIHHTPGLPAKLNIITHGQHAVVLGQHLTNIEAPIVLSEDGQIVRITGLHADAGDGVVTVEAWSNIGEARDYAINLELINVPLDGFLSSAVDAKESTADQSPKSRAGGGVNSGGSTQGEVYARLDMGGVRDQPQSRTGRGLLRIVHGKMATVPIAMQVLQAVQLTIPFSGTIDSADADVYIQGDRIVFERILFESTVGKNAMLQLLGEGEMDFNTFMLDTRFRSRSGVAIIRDIVGGIGDKLYGIEVTGPLSNPQARVVPLPRD